MPMISIISENDTFYSVHTDEVEAETYLETLKKRWPESSWEHDRVLIGPKFNQGKLAWAGTGTWDFVEKKVINFCRAFIFTSEFTNVVLTKGQTVHRFVSLKLEPADSIQFDKAARLMMLKYKTGPLEQGERGVPFSDQSVKIVEVGSYG